ncbi:MAG: Rne/Rng family ribonuclease [Gemmatimonadetes bacterium]|nr:MAG: Rne/Rng family ribonuclease [Gemmatimonadota bacterium]
MYTEIIVNVNPNETRIAILEDQQLVELLIERAEKRRVVGDIYKGRVDAVIPGMQAAFVDIGMEKAAFLHVSDMLDMDTYNREFLDMDDDDEDETSTNGKSNRKRSTRRTRREYKPIQKILKEGQEIIVQVKKEPISTKGARITTQISLAGRFLVMMPGAASIGVSRKIQDEGRRKELKKFLRRLLTESNSDAGFIVRTAAGEQSNEDLKEDMQTLEALWNEIKQKADKAKPPALIHQDAEMVGGLVRDVFTKETNRLVIDDKDEYEDICNYLETYAPELKEKTKLYTEDTPIFDAYSIEPQIEKALRRKVWLRSGGYIIIDHTEALTAIDVNTGKFIGRENQEQTILQTNLEAADEIARQLRLRDIGGIIVLDFIDMEHESNKQKVLNALKNAMRNDRSRPKICQVSDLGLIEMTRKRVRPSLVNTFYEPCPTCDGTGRVVSRSTTAMKIERWLNRAGAYSSERDLLVYAHPVIVDFISGEDDARLSHLREKYKMDIKFEVDPNLRIDKFKIVSIRTGEEITEHFLS